MDFVFIFLALASLNLARMFINWLLKQPMVSNLESRYVLITGCDTGFGNATAKRLDSLGCNVIAGCLTENGETELRKSCSKNLHTVPMDVSNPESVKKAHELVKKILPPGKGLWGLINNAGVFGRNGPLQWNTLRDFQKVADINLFGPINVTLTFLPLIQKEKGRVVNMSSMAGRIALGPGPYCVTKFGVEAFSDSLRRDMRPFKVSVSIVEPTGFGTKLTANFQEGMRNMYDELPKEIRDMYGEDYFNGVLSLLEKLSNQASPDLSPVVKAYTHGILGRFPRARYPVGMETPFVMNMQNLPEWLTDRLVQAFLPYPKPAACK